MISVFGCSTDKREIDLVTETIQSQWLGLGDKVVAFEEGFQLKNNLSSFLMVDSGSNALLLAVSLLNLPPKSEIILPSYTWVSCANSIVLAGHKPIFCDVDDSSMNVTKELIEAKMTDKTAAIMIVHYAGLPVEMDEIISLGLPIIEDAAHAVCSTYKGRPCGNISDVGIFSFDSVKNLAAGEGGGISTRDGNLIEEAKKLRYCGIEKSGFQNATDDTKLSELWWEYQIAKPFIKMLPNNVSASIALAQLDKIDQLQARRETIWNFYQSEFTNNPNIITPQDARDGEKHSYFTYCIKVNKRNELARYLLEKNIYTTLRYHPLHLYPIYNQDNIKLTNTEILNKTALNIPLHPRLSDDDISYVVSAIKNFFK